MILSLFVAAGLASAAEERCITLASSEPLSVQDAEKALPACAEGVAARPTDARLLWLHGRTLYVLQQDEEALKVLSAAGNAGSASALRLLGQMHRWGYGVEADPAKAVEYYRRALAKGDIAAAAALAESTRSGEGVEKNLEAAAKLYKLAADAGVAEGQLGLGYAYETGAGVRKDVSRAAELYRAAAAQGDYQAQYNLGVLSDRGSGMPKDRREALRWYRMSASNGSTDAMFALALAYLNGNGVTKDVAMAEEWLQKGIEGGDKVDAPNSLAYLWAGENRNLEKAAALAEGALLEDPRNAAVMDTLGLIRLRQRRFSEAVRLAEQSIAIKPLPLYHTRLGDIYEAMGRRKDATEAWRRALQVLPPHEEGQEIKAEDLRCRLSGLRD